MNYQSTISGSTSFGALLKLCKVTWHSRKWFDSLNVSWFRVFKTDDSSCQLFFGSALQATMPRWRKIANNVTNKKRLPEQTTFNISETDFDRRSAEPSGWYSGRIWHKLSPGESGWAVAVTSPLRGNHTKCAFPLTSSTTSTLHCCPAVVVDAAARLPGGRRSK